MDFNFNRCDWCSQQIQSPDDLFPGLCGQCVKHANSKLELCQPGEELSPEELKALCRMDYDEDSQAIMDDFIKKQCEAIQAGWSENTEESRRAIKKKRMPLPKMFASLDRARFRSLSVGSLPRT